jgi:site-specific recombinase XerD
MVKGYPDRLKIYRIPASPYWWVRATFGDRRLTKSTKEIERHKAVSFAKNFYDECLLTRREIPLQTSRQFGRCADLLLEECQRRSKTGERNPRFARDLKQILNQRILPFFKTYRVEDITYQHLSRFVDSMRADECSASTIKRALVSVRQVLKHGIKLGLIHQAPVFPTISYKESPRPWFSPDEYEHLKNVAEELANRKPSDDPEKKIFTYKGERVTEETRDFIIFMVNSFLRPSDWVELKRKHITKSILEKTKKPILVIHTPTSKTVNTPVITMEAAAGVYDKIVARQDTQGTHGSEAFVFLPQIENRDRAEKTMRALFNHVLEEAKLRKNNADKNRTIYSLRHTAIAMRFLKGEGVDLLFLARNCRTSVEMIDRFYARHLSAMMAPERIIGLRVAEKKTSHTRQKKSKTDLVGNSREKERRSTRK